MEAVQKNPKESIASHREKTHARNLHSSTLIAVYANVVDRWRFINFRRNEGTLRENNRSLHRERACIACSKGEEGRRGERDAGKLIGLRSSDPRSLDPCSRVPRSRKGLSRLRFFPSAGNRAEISLEIAGTERERSRTRLAAERWRKKMRERGREMRNGEKTARPLENK